MGSGGRKASFEAMTDGHGGQQKRQHSSENESPFIVDVVVSVLSRREDVHSLGGGGSGGGSGVVVVTPQHVRVLVVTV